MSLPSRAEFCSLLDGPDIECRELIADCLPSVTSGDFALPASADLEAGTPFFRTLSFLDGEDFFGGGGNNVNPILGGG